MVNIFDQPWTLLIAAILTLPVLLIFRRILPEKQRWWQWLLPALLAVAAFGLDFLVQTDTEKITAVIKTGTKAVEEENPDAIEAIIADNYRDSYHNTKQSLMRHCTAKLSGPLIEKAVTRIVSIEVSPPKATAIFTVRILFDKQSYVYQSFKSQMLTKVKVDLQKEPDNKWIINRAELLEIDLQPANWKNIEKANW